eukprot:gene11119-12387_t
MFKLACIGALLSLSCWAIPLHTQSSSSRVRHFEAFSSLSNVDQEPLRDNIHWTEFQSSISSRSFQLAEVKDISPVFDYSIANDLPEPFGIQTWDSAHLMATLLETTFPQGLRGRTIVDLGCGTGLLSILCASMGGNVRALDYNQFSLHLTRLGYEKYCGQQDLPQERYGSMCYELFDMMDFTQSLPACDLLLMSDILYMESIAVGAARRAMEALEKYNATVVVTDPGRSTAPFFVSEVCRGLRGSSWQGKEVQAEEAVFKPLDEKITNCKGQVMWLNRNHVL